MKKTIALLLCAALLFVFAACGAETSSAPDETAEAPSTDASESETASEISSVPTQAPESSEETSEETTGETETSSPASEPGTADGIARFTTVSEALAGMTLEEKVGQLFIVMPEALYPSQRGLKLTEHSPSYAFSLSQEMKETFEAYPAGGFILFGGNISGGGQLKELTASLHSLGRVRPYVYIDEEGGTVARIGNSDVISVPKFGNMQSVAETGDPANAYEVGASIGGYLAEYGVDLDFAPVADVNTNPDNPVIGRRAFGSDPETAGEMVAAVIEGLHSAGVGSCIKHFPGHGDTNTDTHKAYAETLKTWEEIASCEMLPFIAGMEAGTDMVMAAHIAAPNVTGDDTPATLSYTLVTEKLRGELGYDGVVVTDSMAMLAVAERYSPAEAALAAFKAGVDIVLIPDDYIAAFEGILSAVQSGEISEARLNESVERILRMKME